MRQGFPPISWRPLLFHQRAFREEKAAAILPNTHMDPAVSKVSATRPKIRHQIPEPRIRNQGPVVAIHAHHLPPQPLNP